MTFHSLPKDLQILVLEFNCPPRFDAGLAGYLEWMWDQIETHELFKVMVEFCVEKLPHAGERYTEPPVYCSPQFGTWEVHFSVEMREPGVWEPPDEEKNPVTTFRIHWETWDSLHTYDVKFVRYGKDFSTINLLDYAPRQVKSIPICIICPNTVVLDGEREEPSQWWDFQKSELMTGAVRFRNEYLLS